MNSAHWQTEIEGLGAIVRLMKYHSDIILVDVNDLIHAVNHECKNLRSQVCVFFLCPLIINLCIYTVSELEMEKYFNIN